MKKIISIVTITYNEEGNIGKLYSEIVQVMKQLPEYKYEIIIADNCSQDNTITLLRNIAARDDCVNIILNANNFGATRSQLNALISARGDAAIVIPADLQIPPSIFPGLLKEWEKGNEVVCATYIDQEVGHTGGMQRKLYYKLMQYLSETPHIPNFTGPGLYDRRFINALKQINEPEPYLRGLVGEIGFRQTNYDYKKQPRTAGESSYKFLKMYDVAVTGLVSHSKVPMRFTTFLGVGMAGISFLCACIYFILKLMFWDSFSMGIAPLIIGVFFLFSIQFIIMGVLGEYVVATLTQVKNRPLVIERERINFKPLEELCGQRQDSTGLLVGK